jgi:hypothetical protein
MVQHNAIIKGEVKNGKGETLGTLEIGLKRYAQQLSRGIRNLVQVRKQG